MYAFVIASCIACGNTITFNPHKVPSIKVLYNEEGRPVPDERGVREPLCFGCATQLNDNREAEGLAAIPIQPDAYEAIHESEL